MKTPARMTDLERLDYRLGCAAHSLREANENLHRAEVEHREAREAVDAELRRLARATVNPGGE